jgi:polyhydroxybutyrate depolymerase
MRFPVVVAALSAFFFATPIKACSDQTPCMVDERSYYIATPKDPSQISAAVIYLHGWGGSGKGALRNQKMVKSFLERGFAVIAPDGTPREGRSGRSWGFHPDSGRQEAEVTFLAKVREDVEHRLGLVSERIVLSGFSIGGSMVAYTACLSPETFSAYAPIGGNFWRPHPIACQGPVRMLHTHGWRDGTVPLEGRVVNGVPGDDPSAFTQGDIFHAMSVWRHTNQCKHLKADRFEVTPLFWRRIWDRCALGSALELALFPGGHNIPDGWPDLVADWFEGL